ncbi:MAG: MFS transporter [Armatimonadota bacterium]
MNPDHTSETRDAGGTAEHQSVARWGVLLAIGAGTFMSALDGSVVNTILPVVARDFGAGVASVQWVVTVYLLVVSGSLLGFGRLGDILGHGRVYLSGMGLFVAASVMCGAASSLPLLVAGRALQGVGAAMLFANGPAILTRAFPATRRGQVLGLQATMTYLGLTAGPSVGGALAQAFSWRAVYFVNVPVGLAALALGMRRVPREDGGAAGESFDLPGAAAFTCSLVVLLLALNRGHDWGWASPGLLVLMVASAAGFGLFLRIERASRHPMLDLSLFSERLFSASAASALMNYMSISSMTFVLPFLLIEGRGLSVGHAGLLMTAQPLVMAFTAPLSGTLSDRIGSRIPATAGMILVSLGLALLAWAGAGQGLAVVAASLMLVGLGAGLFTSPNNSALMGSAPRNRQGIASGVLAVARNLGFALGVGVSGAVFTTVLDRGAHSAGALVAGARASCAVAAVIAAAGAFTSGTRDGGRQASGKGTSAA